MSRALRIREANPKASDYTTIPQIRETQTIGTYYGNTAATKNALAYIQRPAPDAH